MDGFSFLVAEQMVRDRQRELEAISREGAPSPTRAGRGVRHTLAATFVRVGIRLDPAAGEGLPAFDVTFAGEKGGC